ncbi:MAG: arylsulfatase [Acidobacteria bacterium]|nr:arylsulfatase [Acidobacteriota bacterium]
MNCIPRRALLQAAAAPAVLRSQQRLPNVVFLLLDDLGVGDVGCFGQTKIKTPNIDRLGSEGLRFTSAYAGGTVCAPSRCSLMTGLHNGHAAIRANAGTAPIAPGDVTFVTHLKKAGYATGGFGKWGLGDAGTTGAPERHGFDEFFGYLHQIHAHNYYTDFLWNNGKRHEIPDNRDGGRKVYSADVIAERSYDFLRRRKDSPFFLYATYTLPHAAYEVPGQGEYAKQPWPEVEKNMASMVTRADDMAGRLLGLLRDLRLEENTLVLFASDNGAPTGGSHSASFFNSTAGLRGAKGTMYEGGIRIPAIARWPGRIKAGSVSATPWAFCDLFPTFLDLAGLRAPVGLDGRNLMPLFLGKETRAPERTLYWENWGFDFKTSTLPPGSLRQAARVGNWKAVKESPARPLELFDLATDPFERTDLSAAEPTVAARMAAVLKQNHTPPRPHAGGTRDWVK